MEIKKFKSKKDIERVIDLFIKTFAEKPYFEKWTKLAVLERLIHIYKRGKDFCLYIENENKKVIAFIFCYKYLDYDGINLVIEYVAVDKNYRNNGLGKKLILEIEKIAKEQKIIFIALLANKDSKAYNFWNKKCNYKLSDYIRLEKKL
ncbi:MAG: GNAT family N-acetyltransferase [archaeon]